MPKPRCQIKVGDSFGRLTVAGEPILLPHGNGTDRQTHVVCKCECGEYCLKVAYHLIDGRIKSCGCLQAENRIAMATKHGELSGRCSGGRAKTTRLYRAWVSMRMRCSNSNERCYENYGGRGIFVCQEWQDFVAFREWATSNGFSEKLKLDRIDNSGPYAPWNCRWATRRQQANNKRSNRRILAFGEDKTLSEWLRDPRVMVSAKTIRSRLIKGWNPDEALSTET